MYHKHDLLKEPPRRFEKRLSSVFKRYLSQRKYQHIKSIKHNVSQYLRGTS